MANLLKKGKKGGGWTKLRMLNIEVVAGGLMKLTMQVNSLLRVPHPPPPSSLCPFISLACCEESFGAAWEGGRWCHRYPCMEGLEGLIQGQKPQY